MEGLIVFLVMVLVVYVMIRGNKGYTDQPPSGQDMPENYMPAHNRLNDRNLMTAYVYAAGWIIKKNPRDSRNKVKFVHTYFQQHFKEASNDIAVEMANALKYPVNIRSVANWVNRKLRKAEERKQLVDFVIALAFEDGDMIEPEFVAATRFAELIGIHGKYIEQEVIRKREEMGNYHRDATSDLLSNRLYKRRKACACLGLEEKATVAEIKKAYRTLVQQYHPDKLIASSQEERDAAEAKFREIQEAYEFLTESR
jgi:DnaJ like chaperone protein